MSAEDIPESETVVGSKRVLMEELECLWDDLNKAQQHAINTDWSIECANLRERILALTGIVGPVDPMTIQMPLLLAGYHERVYEGSDIDAPEWDREHVQATWDRYEARQAETLARYRR